MDLHGDEPALLIPHVNADDRRIVHHDIMAAAEGFHIVVVARAPALRGEIDVSIDNKAWVRPSQQQVSLPEESTSEEISDEIWEIYGY